MRCLHAGLAAVALAGVSLAAVAQDPQPVTWKPLAEVLVHTEREAPAAALSLNESRIASEVTARVRAIPAEVGAVVEAGGVLIELDRRDAELALERAQAALASVLARIRHAEFQLQRARELHKRNFASDDMLTQRETELDVLRAERAGAEAQRASAQRELDKCTVRAPYRAIVHARQAQVGELATPGTPLLTLIDVSRIEVSAQIQPKDSAALQGAQDIRFVAPGEEHPLRLLRISPAIDRATRTQEARLAFAAEPAAPGTEGRIRWRGDGNLLPAELLSRREGRLGVFVAAGDTARFIVLEQAQEGRSVAINLAPDTRIILDGRFGLQDGQTIAPKP
jgi:RND family efflux transporter MFP subunit